MSFSLRGKSIIWVLALTLCCWVEAQSKSKDEWILVRKPGRDSWATVLSTVKDFSLVSSFGPEDRFALVRENRKSRSPFPKEIIGIQRNHTYRALEQQDPQMGKSWALSNLGQTIENLGNGIKGIDIGAIKTWDTLAETKNAVIAILDSGIDLNHEDLKNNLWVNLLELEPNLLDDDHNQFVNDLHGWNFVDNNNNVQDDNNHGTSVAGVIGADAKNGLGTRGLIEKGALMVVKILDSNGTGSTEKAVRGIEYAVKNGAKVINASWGGTIFDQALFDTIQWANEKGVLVVCAAGNEPKDNDTDERPIYPASFRLSNIVSVAAHDFRGEMADFTSYGKDSVHLAAPGVGIFTTMIGGYRFMDGTSFAAPFVVAASALLKTQEPNLTPNEIKKRLIGNAIPMHYYVKEKLNSGGRLNAYSLLKNVVTPQIPTPTQWNQLPKTIETAHPYSNNFKQVFEVVQTGAKHMRVHFVKLELENSYDTVALKDSQGRIAMTYTGKMNDFWSADILGDKLQLEFVSDFSNAQWGFAIDLIEFSANKKLRFN